MKIEDHIKHLEKTMKKDYPIEYNYGSKCSLWACALNDGSISREDYDAAKKHYGSMWNYACD